MHKIKVLISNIGFGIASPASLKMLQEHAHVAENINNIRFTEEDFLAQIKDVNIIIAGTEKISSKVILAAKKLKMIARVGVGVDNIDLEAAQANNIQISYTPDAPSTSVPEFTIALILNLIKGIGISDRLMHNNIWHRQMGRSLKECRIGVIGAGKIGQRVIKLLLSLEPHVEIFYHDPFVNSVIGAHKTSLNDIFKICDVITLHIPLDNTTHHMVSQKQLNNMPIGSYVINTSRGEVIDEKALYQALQNNLGGAALDVFEQEPYTGQLCGLQNCLLTAHIGSMTIETRALMEKQVVEDVINLISQRSLIRLLQYTS